MEEQAASNPNWKRDNRRRAVHDVLWKIRIFFLGIFWKVLFFLHINRIASRMMCRLNIYAKYGLNGRCQWCGEKHGLHWKIKLYEHGGLVYKNKLI